VLEVKASASTRNVLFRYDRRRLTEQALLEQLRAFRPQAVPDDAPTSAPPEAPARPPAKAQGSKGGRRRPAAVVEGKGKHRRARIAVRGLHRDPGLARKLVEKLETELAVAVRPNFLTGRINVEYDHTLVEIEELLTMVGELEMPPLGGEDHPRHPLAPGPLRESAVRMWGSLLGLGVITLQELCDHSPGAVLAGC
jgi:hypothetical protein